MRFKENHSLFISRVYGFLIGYDNDNKITYIYRNICSVFSYMSAVFKNISLLNGKRHLAFKYIFLIKLDLSIEVVDKSEDNMNSFIDSFNGV